MSDRIAIVKALHDAVEADDVAATLGYLHPKVDWHPGAFVTGRRQYTGHAGVRHWFADVRRISNELHELISVFWTGLTVPDDWVLASGHVRIHRSECVFGTDFANAYTFGPDDLITAMTWFPTPEAALEELG